MDRESCRFVANSRLLCGGLRTDGALATFHPQLQSRLVIILEGWLDFLPAACNGRSQDSQSCAGNFYEDWSYPSNLNQLELHKDSFINADISSVARGEILGINQNISRRFYIGWELT